MRLTNDQVIAITMVLTDKGLKIDISDLTDFKDFDYYWVAMFGYTNTLVKFLLKQEEL